MSALDIYKYFSQNVLTQPDIIVCLLRSVHSNKIQRFLTEFCVERNSRRLCFTKQHRLESVAALTKPTLILDETSIY
jgi:hypothetical protein